MVYVYHNLDCEVILDQLKLLPIEADTDLNHV